MVDVGELERLAAEARFIEISIIPKETVKTYAMALPRSEGQWYLRERKDGILDFLHYSENAPPTLSRFSLIQQMAERPYCATEAAEVFATGDWVPDLLKAYPFLEP